MAGPDSGYYPNAGKCWLFTKPDKEKTARSVFEKTAIKITREGGKHLDAVLGSRSYLEQYVNGKQKFGFINGVDNVNWPPYRDSKS